jgi:hypothetical protein
LDAMARHPSVGGATVDREKGQVRSSAPKNYVAFGRTAWTSTIWAWLRQSRTTSGKDRPAAFFRETFIETRSTSAHLGIAHLGTGSALTFVALRSATICL